MTPQHILEQKLRAAEETIEDLQRKLEHAQSQRNLATILAQQAEATAAWAVGELCECVGCSRRRAS